jgi:hypothetical protein
VIVTSEQLKAIVGAGGGLVLDASAFTLTQLREIASAAPSNRAALTLKNLSGLTADQLLGLATLAPGLIVFDLSPDASA